MSRQCDPVWFLIRAGVSPLLAAVLFVSCGRSGPPAGAAPVATHRIVVMAPSAAEMLAALGAADEVVAVGDFVAWPPELAVKPKVGAYDQPSLEAMVALRATDFVTARSVAGASSAARLRELGVSVAELDTSTYEGSLAAMTALGERFGRNAQAAAMVRQIRATVASVEQRARAAPRRRVLFVVGRDPVYAAGPGSHIDGLIRAAGGENVAGDAPSSYAQIALEAILDRRPEVILDSSDNGPTAPRGRVTGPWSRWAFLPAVSAGRVFFLDPVRLSVPGPRLGEMALLMGRLIHPEIFGEPTAEELGPLRRATGDDAAP